MNELKADRCGSATSARITMNYEACPLCGEHHETSACGTAGARCAVAAGSGLYREHEVRVIEKYKITTLRHAANAIFNQLNAAYSCGPQTDQGRQALIDAQALADVIVASPAATAAIGPNTKGTNAPVE